MTQPQTGRSILAVTGEACPSRDVLVRSQSSAASAFTLSWTSSVEVVKQAVAALLARLQLRLGRRD